MQLLDALRLGCSDEELQERRYALLAEAAPDLNPGLNPDLDPTSATGPLSPRREAGGGRRSGERRRGSADSGERTPRLGAPLRGSGGIGSRGALEEQPPGAPAAALPPERSAHIQAQSAHLHSVFACGNNPVLGSVILWFVTLFRRKTAFEMLYLAQSRLSRTCSSALPKHLVMLPSGPLVASTACTAAPAEVIPSVADGVPLQPLTSAPGNDDYPRDSAGSNFARSHREPRKLSTSIEAAPTFVPAIGSTAHQGVSPQPSHPGLATEPLQGRTVYSPRTPRPVTPRGVAPSEVPTETTLTGGRFTGEGSELGASTSGIGGGSGGLLIPPGRPVRGTLGQEVSLDAGIASGFPSCTESSRSTSGHSSQPAATLQAAAEGEPPIPKSPGRSSSFKAAMAAAAAAGGASTIPPPRPRSAASGRRSPAPSGRVVSDRNEADHVQAAAPTPNMAGAEDGLGGMAGGRQSNGGSGDTHDSAASRAAAEAIRNAEKVRLHPAVAGMPFACRRNMYGGMYSVMCSTVEFSLVLARQ